MSLIKLAEFAKPENQLGKPQRGEVIDNEDPKKLGRVKLKIKGLIEGDRENIPWTYPRNPNLHGGTSKASGHHVPEIGSNLVVEFPHGNIYQAYYKSTWHSADNFVKKTFDTNYPHKYGWQDAGKNAFTQDKIDGSLEYNHFAEYKKKEKLDGTYGGGGGEGGGGGSYDDTDDDSGGDSGGDSGSGGQDQQQQQPKLNMKIEKDGTLNVTTQAKINVTAKGDITIKGDGKLTATIKGDVSISSEGDMTLKAKTITLDGNVKLGGSGANRAVSLKDSIDSKGDTQVGNLATKVTGM